MNLEEIKNEVSELKNSELKELLKFLERELSLSETVIKEGQEVQE